MLKEKELGNFDGSGSADTDAAGVGWELRI
jgi:hypothetical protein